MFLNKVVSIDNDFPIAVQGSTEFGPLGTNKAF